MTSLYNQVVPPMINSLRALSVVLTEAVKYADEKSMPHEDLLKVRLADDMRPLTYQVQCCSNAAKGLAVRLGVIENIYLEDNEETFEQLQARINRTIEILSSVKPEGMNGKEQQEVVMATERGKYHFTGQSYVSGFVVPFFHFHFSTAYCILRFAGVPLNADHYLGEDVENSSGKRDEKVT